MLDLHLEAGVLEGRGSSLLTQTSNRRDIHHLHGARRRRRRRRGVRGGVIKHLVQAESEQGDQRDDQDRHEGDRPTLAPGFFRLLGAFGPSRSDTISLSSGSWIGTSRGGSRRSSRDEVGLLLRVSLGIGVSPYCQWLASRQQAINVVTHLLGGLVAIGRVLRQGLEGDGVHLLSDLGIQRGRRGRDLPDVLVGH